MDDTAGADFFTVGKFLAVPINVHLNAFVFQIAFQRRHGCVINVEADHVIFVGVFPVDFQRCGSAVFHDNLCKLMFQNDAVFQAFIAFFAGFVDRLELIDRGGVFGDFQHVAVHFNPFVIPGRVIIGDVGKCVRGVKRKGDVTAGFHADCAVHAHLQHGNPVFDFGGQR